MLDGPFATRLHQRLFSLAYRLHEAELGLFASLPWVLRRTWPDWPATAVGIDVGAGLGPFALAMRRYCERLVLVEPNAAQARYLRRAFGGGADIVEAAVSDREGEAVLLDDMPGEGWRRPLARLEFQRADGGSSSRWRQPTPVTTLDALAERFGLLPTGRALVMKIDVEGHELAVLRGASTLLARGPALVMVEIVQAMNAESGAVFDLMAQAGFDAFAYRGGRLEPASHALVVEMAGRTPGRFGRLSGFVSNYIFVRPAA